MQAETDKFIVSYAGVSRDWRTNVWNVKCKKCQKTFTPFTTIMAVQEIICDKCGTSEYVNYNTLQGKNW